MATRKSVPKDLQPKSALVDHYLDLLEPLGGVTARAMFGEHGFFKNGSMFACIWQHNFYVRTDAQNRPAHEALGLEQFVYVGRGKRVGMPYHQVPPGALDDADEMAKWARPAIAAAVRATGAKVKAKAKGKAAPTGSSKAGAKAR